MNNQITSELVFRHLVQFPNFDCVFCSTEERDTGKTRLFLVFNSQKRKVYLRNGLKGTWDELRNEEECDFIRQHYDSAVKERNIPLYSTHLG